MGQILFFVRKGKGRNVAQKKDLVPYSFLHTPKQAIING